MKTKVVSGYARVSTEKQRNEATIETQIERIKRHCEEKGYELLRIYCDEGVSGERTFLHDRPQGSLLLEAARRGEFEAVIVYHPDRLGRKQTVSETVVEQLYEELGILIYDVNNNTDVTTPGGRLMFTMLSAFGVAEMSRIRERSLDGTLRQVKNGAWTGGIVPYGYRIEGRKKDARLRPSLEKIPGLDISEAELIQLMYRWAADDQLSCLKIANRLQAMGAPCSYERDGREILSNKRKQRTANLWRAGRVRNMLVETTYKGIHLWGKRQKKPRPNQELRPKIPRVVPSLVDEATWERAQQTLLNNRLMSPRNSKRDYLLRGKMRCGVCNLAYAGSSIKVGKAENLKPERHHPSYEVRNGFIYRPYYQCTGKNNQRGSFGQLGQRCPSRMISGVIVEEAVWADIECFLREPGAVLEEIQSRLAEGDRGTEKLEKEYSRYESALKSNESEKVRMIDAYAKAIIDEPSLIASLQRIQQGKTQIEAQMGHIELELAKVANQQQQCETTWQLMQRLNHILNGELTYEVKREIVDALVDWIRVDTHGEGKDKRATVQVHYRFENPGSKAKPLTPTETGMDVRAGIC